ncbi:hypothetical protein Q4512_09475 [Oceanihabitans sp. 2_MG-2023]|uniref:hypothetical protein n=1 Tax=Oceanihabitans sp. 2_MG-2023 TaxID=3062661 RepID=UPI0026E206AC|nr:hypothetical protein [Oceanihabitans sp. 2_MG-2023]MDO6597141.1 hypothetical protein [Oceanihabitans sp. 2_MG-2023]
MDIVIKSTLNTLSKSQVLLSKLSNDQLGDISVPPYFSSVGSHIRHILDFYNCIFSEVNREIDLTARNRNVDVETCCDTATCYLNTLIEKVSKLKGTEINREVFVIDDLGMGKTKLNYTFSAILAQANSHTIHHYAIISYILDRIDVEIEDETFGYNPTTPRQIILK